jgi:hypothetical protein
MIAVGSIAASFIAAQVAELQTAMAAKMLKMNADQGANAVKLIDAAQQNMNSLANVGTGVGQNLNITV